MMSAINNLFEDAKYLISRMLGGKTREQIAEEERKAAEQKAREEHDASMEQERKEREATEKKQKEFIGEITSALGAGKNVSSQYEIIDKGADDDDFYNGSGLLTQKLKINISVEDNFTATVIVSNDPESEKYKAREVREFLYWRGCDIQDPSIDVKSFQGELSKENLAAIKEAVKKCGEITKCIDDFKRNYTAGFLDFYKSEWMSVFRPNAKCLGTLKLTESEGNHFIVCNESKIPFNSRHFEFSKKKLAEALGCNDLSYSTLLIFEERIKRIARYKYNLESIASKDYLEKIIEDHNSKTGIKITLNEVFGGIYTLSSTKGCDGVEIVKGCEKVALGEAFGTVLRRLEEFDSYKPKHTYASIENKLKQLTQIVSNGINSSYNLRYKIFEFGGPGIYRVDFAQTIEYPDNSKDELTGYGYNPRTINDLVAKIDQEISRPDELIKMINDDIREAKRKWRPRHDLKIRPY